MYYFLFYNLFASTFFINSYSLIQKYEWVNESPCPVIIYIGSIGFLFTFISISINHSGENIYFLNKLFSYQAIMRQLKQRNDTKLLYWNVKSYTKLGTSRRSISINFATSTFSFVKLNKSKMLQTPKKQLLATTNMAKQSTKLRIN